MITFLMIMKWAYVAMLVLNIFLILKIGEERKPLTGMDVVLTLILSYGLIAVLILL